MDFGFRAGIGYDVHRLVPERPLILGGVEIAWDYGLLGHSDADVLTHAVMDAMLGAMGKGDIGGHFPDTDQRFNGISSMKLLEEVKNILDKEGFAIANIDTVIAAQKPKLSPFTSLMAENLAHILEIDPAQINVKATTEEGLGFTGDGSGISARAVVLLYKLNR